MNEFDKAYTDISYARSRSCLDFELNLTDDEVPLLMRAGESADQITAVWDQMTILFEASQLVSGLGSISLVITVLGEELFCEKDRFSDRFDLLDRYDSTITEDPLQMP